MKGLNRICCKNGLGITIKKNRMNRIKWCLYVGYKINTK